MPFYRKEKAKQALLLSLVATVYGTVNLFVLLIKAVTSGQLGGKILPSALAGALASNQLLFAILSFFATYLALHAAIGVLWAIIWNPINQLLLKNKNQKAAITILSFFPVLLWIQLSNTYLFPSSQFSFSNFTSKLTPLLVSSLFTLTTLYLSSSIAISAWLYWTQNLPSIKYLATNSATKVTALTLIFILLPYQFIAGSPQEKTQRSEPDVIFIGIDCLRIDHIGYLRNSKESSLTPNLDQFLSSSTVFQEAWTPLARTFPAWVSILTGEYPVKHGGYYNLIARNQVNDENNITRQLESKKYYRIFAIDEARFSNIDRSYGFDEVISPKMGAADFLLGYFSDAPMINLITNTEIGKWIFPYFHMNRALAHLYTPNLFTQKIANSVKKTKQNRPLFLAVHFELPHWPYRWAHPSALNKNRLPATLADVSPKIYQSAIRRADLQLASLLGALRESGRLNNAIVVVLSDHGEAFVKSEPTWTAINPEAPKPIQAGWHGTNVMSEAQYRVLLAFRGYGPQKKRPKNKGQALSAGVSLTDVKPTITDWLSGKQKKNSIDSGLSLLPLIKGERFSDNESKGRPLLMESGFWVKAMANSEIKQGEVATQGVKYYSVDKNGMLSIKDYELPALLKRKQRAAVLGDWVLAAIPREGMTRKWNIFLGNRSEKLYWHLQEGVTVPEDAPISSLYNSLCRHFHSLKQSYTYGPKKCHSLRD